MQTRAKIQLVIVHKMNNYHADDFILILRKKVGATIEDAIVTGLVGNNEAICSKLNAVVAKAMDGTINDKQAYSAICQTTSRTIDSESFVEKLIQRIVEDDKVVNLVATNARRHLHKVMEDSQVTTNMAKTVV